MNREQMEIHKKYKNIEIRQLDNIQADVNEGVIKGTAIVFNKESQIMYSEKYGKVIEIIKPEAATSEFINSQDIILLYNHNPSLPLLARSRKSQGTLKVWVDNIGVHFSFKPLNKDQWLVESVNAGDLDGCSFGFLVDKEGFTLEYHGDFVYRIINKFSRIIEFSIVIDPVYEETEVSQRSMEMIENELELRSEKNDNKNDLLELESDQKVETEAEKKKREKAEKEYYDSLKNLNQTLKS